MGVQNADDFGGREPPPDWDNEPPADYWLDDTDTAEPARSRTKGKATRPPSAADVCARIGQERYRLGTSTTGEPFAVPLEGPQNVLMLRGGASSLRAELAAAHLAETSKVAPQQALADALMALEGIALSATPQLLALRVAEVNGELWLDLGDKSGEVVRITGEGWTILPNAPVLFRRTALTAPFPRPPARGDLGDLWGVLNVAEADKPVLLAFMVAAFMPEMPHPILSLIGEQGTGKSTASKVIGSCLDPSTVPLRKTPKDLDGWTTAAQGSHVVPVDNLSGLPDWFSDALCRASTGDGDVRRKLYSDGDLYVFAYKRVVILNGIDLGTVRDDLADRLVTVELERITEAGRKRDVDLASQWNRAAPSVLAGLLDLTAQVLDRMPTITLERSPRMADFARVLATLDAILGTDGLSRYAALAGELATDAVTSDPVLSLLGNVITREWSGTARELLAILNESRGEGRPSREWPGTARALAGLLKRRAPSLRRVGWTVEQTGKHTERGLVWRLVAPAQRLTKPDETLDENSRQSVRQDFRQPHNPAMTTEDVEMAGNPDELTKKPTNLSVLIRSREEESPEHTTTRVVPEISSVRRFVSQDPETSTDCRLHGTAWVPDRCWTCEQLAGAR